MTVIWKYAIYDTVEMPKGAKVISVQLQDETLTLWAAIPCPVSSVRQIRHFEIVGTGYAFEERNTSYLGTIQRNGYVWHVIERHQENH